MFVDTYIFYLKTVQNILAIGWIWGKFISFYFNSCRQESAFLQLFGTFLDNKKRSGIKI